MLQMVHELQYILLESALCMASVENCKSTDGTNRSAVSIIWDMFANVPIGVRSVPTHAPLQKSGIGASLMA